MTFTPDGTRLLLRLSDETLAIWDSRDYRSRQLDRDARFAERRFAEAYVAILLTRDTEIDRLADDVRRDSGLSPLRRAVVLEVLRERLDDIDARVKATFAKLRAEHLTPDSVRSSVDNSDLRGRELRELKLKVANWRPDADELFEVAWHRSLPMVQYAGAEECLGPRQASESWWKAAVRGALALRQGRSEEAAALLANASRDAAAILPSNNGDPHHQARTHLFAAIALKATGRHKDAVIAMSRYGEVSALHTAIRENPVTLSLLGELGPAGLNSRP